MVGRSNGPDPNLLKHYSIERLINRTTELMIRSCSVGQMVGRSNGPDPREVYVLCERPAIDESLKCNGH